ncbi:MAG: porphyrinogen peroxidase [Actinomycetota bacterium]|nr:porphyrinogen peroxidase [Actinomycetota bacterium]
MPEDGSRPPPTRPNAFYVQTSRQPQPGLLPPVDRCTGVVVVHLREGFDPRAVGDAIAACPSAPAPPSADAESLVAFAGRSAAVHRPEVLHVVVGIGTHRFGAFFPDSPLPKRLGEFEELCSADGRHRFPATGGDVLLHVKSSRQDLVVGVVEHLRRALGRQVAPGGFALQYGATAPDGRNSFGRPDAGSDPRSTANPSLDVGPVCRAYPFGEETYRAEHLPEQLLRACGPAGLRRRQELAARDLHADLGRIATSCIGDEDSAHLNGSFCLVQRFLHDLGAFEALPPEARDAVFGRRSQDGARLGDDGGDPVRALPRAHVVRARVRMTETDGRADPSPCLQNGPGASLAPLQIYRQGAEFTDGDGTRGTVFVAYARYCDTFDLILLRMLGRVAVWPGSPPDVDHLLEFTTATTGQYFYVPNLEELAALSEHPLPRDGTDPF